MFGVRNLADDDPEYLLREVLRVLSRDALPTKPRVDQRRIEINRPLPRDGIRTIMQPLQQIGSRLGHGAVLPTDRSLSIARGNRARTLFVRHPRYSDAIE